MEEGAPTLLLAGSKQLLDLARKETTGAAESYAMLAASVLSHGAGPHCLCVRTVLHCSRVGGRRQRCAARRQPFRRAGGLGASRRAVLRQQFGFAPSAHAICLSPWSTAARCLDQKPSGHSDDDCAHEQEAPKRAAAHPAEHGEAEELDDEVEAAFSALSSIDVQALSVGGGGTASSALAVPGARDDSLSPVGTLDSAALAAAFASGRTGSGRTGEPGWGGLFPAACAAGCRVTGTRMYRCTTAWPCLAGSTASAPAMTARLPAHLACRRALQCRPPRHRRARATAATPAAAPRSRAARGGWPLL